MSEHLRDLFRQESEQLLEELENGLVALETRPDDGDIINRVFRAAHTIKGNAGIVGEDALVDFTHLLESLLSQLRDRRISVTPELVSDLLAATDTVKLMVEAANSSQGSASVSDQAARMRLNAHLGKPAGEPRQPDAQDADVTKGPRVYRVEIRLKPDTFNTGLDPFGLLDELAALGTMLQVDTNTSGLPSLTELDPFTLYLDWVAYLYTEAPRAELEAVFIFVAGDSHIRIDDITTRIEDFVDLSMADRRIGELLLADGRVTEDALNAALARQKPVGQLLLESGAIERPVLDKVLRKQELVRSLKKSSSVRVAANKLDALLDLVGELAITASRISQQSRNPETREEQHRATAEALERLTRDIQEQVMGVRMVPVEEAFNRFRRVVRDLAGELGKSVDLEMKGTDTELDKTLVDQLADPLKHMVRNCVDHGIEAPDVRIARGKPPTGKITLEAEQREGRIFVRVSDDGQGVDRERILAKAIDVGLIGKDDVLSDPQILDLIFRPGFSTAAKVTDISGRGVGLDVVRQNVEDLSGTVELTSAAGKGTTFELQLPLTLAIIDGMTVQVGSERLTFPVSSVVELSYPKREELRKLEGHREAILHRGAHIPFVRLYELFGIPPRETDPTRGVVMVLDAAGRRFGALVDEVVGMDQAVVKSLDATFMLFQRLGNRGGRPRGITGATIMADGTVSLIIDIFGLERMALHEDHHDGVAFDRTRIAQLEGAAQQRGAEL